MLNLLLLGKVVDRMAASQLKAFLDDASVLNPFQSGFSRSHVMKTVLVTITDDLQRNLDRGMSALLLLLDLLAAFNMFNHDLLTHCIPDPEL